MPYTIRPATPQDAIDISFDLRQADLDEIAASSGETPADALLYGVEMGPAWVGVDEEGLGAIFGVIPAGNGVGFPWMVATNRLAKHSRQFLRECPIVVRALHALGGETLRGFVDTRNTVHLRWLRWCGFTIEAKPISYGVQGRPFFQFSKVRHV